jgi:transcriptional regulator of acetoin/glycerol metabolism
MMSRVIADTLAECNGRVAQAAQRLGVHRSTIYRHLARQRPESAA